MKNTINIKMKELSKKEKFRQEKIRHKRNKKIITWGSVVLVIVLISFFMINSNNSSSDENLVYGDDVIDMYYFHLSTCPHCHKQNKFHETLKEMYPQLRINEFELTKSGSKEKILEMAKDYPQINVDRISTPTSIIGEEVNTGYGSDETTGQKLIEMIEKEKARIESSWDDTKTRTIDLRQNEEN